MAIAVDPVLSQNEFHKTVARWGTPDAHQVRNGDEGPRTPSGVLRDWLRGRV